MTKKKRLKSCHTRIFYKRQYGFVLPCTEPSTGLTAHVSSHNFLVTFTTNACMSFSVTTCFQQLRLLALDSTSQYFHVRNTECEQFRFVSKYVRFLCTLRCLTHTKYLSILSRVFLLLKNNLHSEQIQAQGQYVNTRRNTGGIFLYILLHKFRSLKIFSIHQSLHRSHVLIILEQLCFKLNISESIFIRVGIMQSHFSATVSRNIHLSQLSDVNRNKDMYT